MVFTFILVSRVWRYVGGLELCIQGIDLGVGDTGPRAGRGMTNESGSRRRLSSCSAPPHDFIYYLSPTIIIHS